MRRALLQLVLHTRRCPCARQRRHLPRRWCLLRVLLMWHLLWLGWTRPHVQQLEMRWPRQASLLVQLEQLQLQVQQLVARAPGPLVLAVQQLRAAAPALDLALLLRRRGQEVLLAAVDPALRLGVAGPVPQQAAELVQLWRLQLAATKGRFCAWTRARRSGHARCVVKTTPHALERMLCCCAVWQSASTNATSAA